MSRLDSLSGASFRPAQQTQSTASRAAEKVASKILDGGSGQSRFQRDAFDTRPSFPKQDPGFYMCTARVPDPISPKVKEDPGLYMCTARVPSPGEPKQDPGLYMCTARVPSSKIEDLLKGLEK